MIQRYLITGVHENLLSAKPIEIKEEEGLCVELALPMEELWKAEKIIKEMEYLTAAADPKTQINALIKDLLRVCSPYAVREKDRIILLQKLQTDTP